MAETMPQRKPTKDQQMFAAVLTQIHLGIAMARAKGVVCGPPQNIRVIKVKT